MSILLRLLLAHIIADFFLQTKWMVEGKENGGKRSLFCNSNNCWFIG